MWRTQGENHCSDETLIQYLDQELATRERHRVTSHVGRCWECRARLSEIEHTIQEFARSIQQTNERERQRVKIAQRRFLALRPQLEMQIATAVTSAPDSSITITPLWRLPQLVYAAVVILAAVGLFGLYGLRRTTSIPAPERILDRSVAAELQVIDSPQPLHQVISVEARNHSNAALQPLGTITVWNDSDSHGRYSMQWAKEDKLEYAVWRPTRGEHYSWSSGSAAIKRTFAPAAESANLVDRTFQLRNGDDLTRGFIRWLKSRDWKPVALGGEWATFAAQDGVELRLRRIDSAAWELTAQKEIDGGQFSAILVIDSGTNLPRVLRIRRSFQGNDSEIRASVRTMELVPAARVSFAMFEPPSTLGSPLRTMRHEDPHLKRSSGEDGEGAAESRQIELLIRSALHNQNECINVRIDRDSSGRIRIRSLLGSVSHTERLREILSSVGESGQFIAPLSNADARSTEEGPGVEATQLPAKLRNLMTHAIVASRHAHILAEIENSTSAGVLTQEEDREWARLYSQHLSGIRLELGYLAAKLEHLPVPNSDLRRMLATIARGSHYVAIPPQFITSELGRRQTEAILRLATELESRLRYMDPNQEADLPSAEFFEDLASLNRQVSKTEESIISFRK